MVKLGDVLAFRYWRKWEMLELAKVLREARTPGIPVQSKLAKMQIGEVRKALRAIFDNRRH
jgi:hypothetical protein